MSEDTQSAPTSTYLCYVPAWGEAPERGEKHDSPNAEYAARAHVNQHWRKVPQDDWPDDGHFVDVKVLCPDLSVLLVQCFYRYSLSAEINQVASAVPAGEE